MESNVYFLAVLLWLETFSVREAFWSFLGRAVTPPCTMLVHILSRWALLRAVGGGGQAALVLLNTGGSGPRENQWHKSSHRASKWQVRNWMEPSVSDLTFCSLSPQYEGAYRSRAALEKALGPCFAWIKPQTIERCCEGMNIRLEGRRWGSNKKTWKNFLERHFTNVR